MRINYATPTPPTANADGSPIPESDREFNENLYTRIAARRKPHPLLPIDFTILHSPPVADGYNALLGAIRSRTILPRESLEICVCRVAALNKAACEWEPHVQLALRAGVTVAQLNEVKTLPITSSIAGNGKTPDSSLTDFQWDLLRLTDAMTVDVEVDHAIFDAVKRNLTEREVVELSACVAAYNMVCRFLKVLDVGENNHVELKHPEVLQNGLE